MARLIPSIAIDEIENKPERDVARTLVEQLPDDVTVFHSYPWLRPERNDGSGKAILRESETDFLVLWPRLGLLVLEVKGGSIRYDGEGRRWYRRLPSGEERDIRDPFEQARKNTHILVDTISNQVYRGERPDFAFGYAVVFPDCDYTGDTPPGSDPAIVFGVKDSPRMYDRIANALRRWSRRDPPRAIDKDELRRIKHAILPCFHLVPVLGRTIEEQEEKLIRLTEEQIRLLDFLGEHKRVAIEGVAGSGKTLMAKAQALRFAVQGRRTLFLCYNRALAEWLRDTVPKDVRVRLHVMHFHRLCGDMCRMAHIDFQPPEGRSSEFWKHEAPELLWEAIEALPDERYDAIVVDEGQDFHPDWWDPIQAIETDCREDHLYVFYDPAQNLYNEPGISIPSLGVPYRLQTNCRNTQAIAETCAQIIGRPITTRPGTPVGIETEVLGEVEPGEVIAHLNRWTKDWIKKEGVAPSQIAILSPYKKSNSVLATREHFSGITITEDLGAWKAGKGILYSTIRSFKGLEADLVVMVDVTEPGSMPAFSKSDFYVGCSRAKHILKILTDVSADTLFGDGDGTNER